MTANTLIRLELQKEQWPEGVAGPASAEQILTAMEGVELPFPADYQVFLSLYGAAYVGQYPIYGVGKPEESFADLSVIQLTQKYRNEGWPGAEGWVVVSMDHAGNPFGVDAEGRVWRYDHDISETELIAKNFEEFLRRRCLELPE